MESWNNNLSNHTTNYFILFTNLYFPKVIIDFLIISMKSNDFSIGKNYLGKIRDFQSPFINNSCHFLNWARGYWAYSRSKWNSDAFFFLLCKDVFDSFIFNVVERVLTTNFFKFDWDLNTHRDPSCEIDDFFLKILPRLRIFKGFFEFKAEVFGLWIVIDDLLITGL